MTEEQKDILDKKFRLLEKRSTHLVLIIIGIILLIHIFFREGSWQEPFVKYTFRFSLLTVILFILAEFLKELYYPILAKIYFKDRQNTDDLSREG